MKKNVIYVFKIVFSEELGLDLNIIIEKVVDEKVNKERFIRINDREMEEKIRVLEIGKVNNCEENEEESYVIKFDVDENLIYGDNVNVMIENIVELNVFFGIVVVVGDIFDVDIKEFKNGKIFMIVLIIDYISLISCKFFLIDINKDGVFENVKKGVYLKIKGDIVYDIY